MKFLVFFYPIKKKGVCNLIFLGKKPLFLILIKNHPIQKSNSSEKNTNLSKTFTDFAEELRLCLNVTNLLQQSLEKHLDYSKKLSILKPLSISIKLMMCLQEEMIYLKRILCLKGDPNLNIEFNLKDFLTEIASLFSFQADMRGIDFQIIFDNNLSSNIQSDPYKIKIILVNLLSKIIVLSYKIT